MQYNDYIDTRSLLEIIRRSCNYIDRRLMDHGLRVAFLISRMLTTYGFKDEKVLRDLILTAMLHDIGAYKTDEISRLLKFDSDDVMNHSVYGYLFMKYFSPTPRYAPAILMHHEPWQTLVVNPSVDEKNRMLAQLIFAADRMDILMHVEGLSSGEALERMEEFRGTIFAPSVLDLIRQCDFHLTSRTVCDPDTFYTGLFSETPFSPDEVIDYLKIIIFDIDFRSRHTVTHTITTTSIGRELAVLCGLSAAEVNQIVCGSLLHDVGKIGIPVEILEYPGKLSPQAMKIMQTHVDISRQIFGGSIAPEVAEIALRHHEKLDGSGYPMGLSARHLTTPQRIVAIADIVSALSGTRSYKKAFPKEKIISILTGMKNDGHIDPQITDLMIGHFDSIMACTATRTAPVLELYHAMQEELEELCLCYGLPQTGTAD